MSEPTWATHKARFCGIVPCWFADEPNGGCRLEGRGWFADRVMFPVVEWAFSLGATIFDWDEWPITITHELTGGTMSEQGRAYTAEEAREQARSHARRAARIENDKYENQAIADEHFQSAATLRAYADMKEAMAEIAEHENGSFCGHYTLNECHAHLVSLAHRFVADKEG